MRFSLYKTHMVMAILSPLCAQTPLIDYHQHLFSPAASALVAGKSEAPGIDAHSLIALLDSAGIRRALVLSARTPGARQAGCRSTTSAST